MVPEQISDVQFDKRVISQMSHPVVVMFSKAGCSACAMVHPHMGHLAAEYEGRAEVLMCDVSKNPGVRKYVSAGLPAVFVFDKGEEVWHRTGGATTARMVGFWVDAALED